MAEGYKLDSKLGHLFEGLEYRGRERPHWRIIFGGVSAIDHPSYPVDQAVVKAIHEFDSNVVPVRVIRAYRALTGEVRIFSRHAIASGLWNPTTRPAPWTERVMRPTWGRPILITQMDLHLEDRASRKGDGLPGPLIPFDWRVYRGLRAIYNRWTAGEKQAYVRNNDRIAQALKKVEKAQANVEERWRTSGHKFRHHWSRIDKQDISRRIAEIVYARPKPMVQIP